MRAMSAPDEPARPARVLIVEDHPIVAAGLTSLLEDHPDITITGVASSVAEVIPAIEKATPDIVVIDYHLPDGTAKDAADRIQSQSPSAAIIIISADAGSEPLLAATDMGAAGYLIKSAAGEEIIATIRAVADGETVMPAGAMTRALALYREGAQQRAHQALLDSLTPRERQVLTLMADGADNRTVAERLHISYATVRTHVRSILAKLGTRSQLETVAKAAEWGFRR
jgi:DNA-binding NarL/FixJ family response regulator